MSSLTFMDLSKLSVALPSIERSLGATSAQLQLSVTGYVLAFGLALVPAGRLGDQWSRRGMLVVGAAVFAVASLGCALAPSAEVLGISRIVQGASSGLIVPQTMGTIQALFTGAARARALGVYGAVVGGSTAFAPALSGLLIAAGGPEWGWRWTFLINVPLAIVAATLLPLLPRQQSGGRVDLDLPGIGLLGIAIACAMTPFVMSTDASAPPIRWLLLLPAAAATLALVVWERRLAASDRAPAIDSRIIGLPGFRVGLAVSFAYFAAFPSILLVVALVLQERYGFTPVLSGLVVIPFAVLSAVLAIFSGAWTARFGRRVLVIGLLVSALALTASILASLDQSLVGAVGLLIAVSIAGAANGVVIAPNQALTLAAVDGSTGSTAGSLLQLSQRLGSTVGLATVLAVYSAIRDSGSDSRAPFAAGMGVVVVFVLAALAAAATGRRGS